MPAASCFSAAATVETLVMSVWVLAMIAARLTAIDGFFASALVAETVWMAAVAFSHSVSFMRVRFISARHFVMFIVLSVAFRSVRAAGAGMAPAKRTTAAFPSWVGLLRALPSQRRESASEPFFPQADRAAVEDRS